MTEVDLGSVPPLRLGLCHPYAVRRGGLGDVYLCRRDIKPALVAVKRLHDDIARSPGAARSFVDECRTWMRLKAHPNVVTAISAHWAEPEPPLVVLEFVPQSLRDLMNRGTLGIDRAIEVGVDVCDAMVHLGESLSGFVHQDLKPENILIDAEGMAKVTDFGLAAVRAGGAVRTGDALAQSTGLVGTPAYMSPEQCLMLNRSSASDIYSLGCVLWEVFTGISPFPDAVGVEDFLDAHVRAAPSLSLPRSRERGADLFRELVEQCLRKSAADRPLTFRDVREVLRQVAAARDWVVAAPRTAVTVEYDTLVQHAHSLVSLGEHEEAREIAQRVYDEVDLNSGKLWAAIVIARSYNDQEQIVQAREWVEAGREWLHDDVGPVIVGAYWTEAARASSDLHQAEQLYRRAVDLVPEASIGWWNLGLAQYLLGAYDKAYDSVRTALRCSRDLRYFVGLVRMLVEQGHHPKAMEVARASVNDYPTAPEAWTAFASVVVSESGVDADVEELGRRLRRLVPLANTDPDEWARRLEALFAELVEGTAT